MNKNINYFSSVIGMPKEKYDPPDPRRMYTIMSSEEAANGKKSYWAELEISGEYLHCVCACVDKSFGGGTAQLHTSNY